MKTKSQLDSNLKLSSQRRNQDGDKKDGCEEANKTTSISIEPPRENNSEREDAQIYFFVKREFLLCEDSKMTLDDTKQESSSYRVDHVDILVYIMLCRDQ